MYSIVYCMVIKHPQCNLMSLSYEVPTKLKLLGNSSVIKNHAFNILMEHGYLL